MSEFDYYQVLNLNRTATIDDINKAFRRLSLKYHPTKNPSDITVCSDQFHQICEAYEVLSDFKSRTVYDKYGAETLSRGLHGTTEVSYPGYKYKRNAFEIFEEFYRKFLPYHEIFDDKGKLLYGSCFGYSFGGILYKKPEKVPEEAHINIECTLDELYNGCMKEYTLNDETKYLEVKPGFSDGHTVVISQENGSVHLHIVQIAHSNYTRRGNDLIYKHNVSLVDALNANSVNFQTLDGRTLHVPVDEIISPQTVRVVDGEGMPVYDPEDEKVLVNNEKRGRLFIVFNIQFPKNLNEDKKKRIVQVLNM